MTRQSHGPLTGLKVVEFAGIGPGPHVAMLLADMGAEVVRIERLGSQPMNEVVERARHRAQVDVKSDAGRAFCLEACRHADVLVEGFRPGVMERLGLGPEVLLEANPRLVYARMTGWGQDGPLAQAASCPCRRRTWSEISAAARSIARSAFSRRSMSANGAAGARWWMPRSSMA
jgi:alpha-methylacyl-CoA racemase